MLLIIVSAEWPAVGAIGLQTDIDLWFDALDAWLRQLASTRDRPELPVAIGRPGQGLNSQRRLSRRPTGYPSGYQ